VCGSFEGVVSDAVEGGDKGLTPHAQFVVGVENRLDGPNNFICSKCRTYRPPRARFAPD
jgi:hypothetical protein